VKDSDQTSNDLDKCCQLVLDEMSSCRVAEVDASGAASSSVASDPLTTVIVLGAYGGRFDQELACLHALVKWADSFDRMVLLSRENVAFLIAPGNIHHIHIRKAAIRWQEGPVCGLIPVFGRVDSITTSGLKWDLQGDSLEFGKLISSSNEILGLDVTSDGDDDTAYVTVSVETSHPVLWTCQLSPGR
jgi:thiamine pyrophosphokinase